MLRSLKDIESYRVHASDGEIGRVSDFLFDDQYWTIRYLVTDTGGFWEGSHPVLISPISFRHVDWTTRLFHLALTQERVKNSPSVDLAKPVSRQYERDYSQYYGWPSYWTFGDSWVWGAGAYPSALAASAAREDSRPTEEAFSDPHLRSAQDVAGYHIRGIDGEIGHIADFIVDDETWTIRYLVIDTSNWWLGKKVLIAPHWAQEISWPESMVYMNLTMDAIKNGPTWSPDAPINRAYEVYLYDYYGRPAYWPQDETKQPASPLSAITQPEAGSAPGTQVAMRDRVLKLLNDDEVARVSAAENAAVLSEGEEYLDLEHIEKGVRCAHGTKRPRGCLLPRKAVLPTTWSKILLQLEAPRA